jgi:glycosyltransferase involved in cell wall biosynthesis
VRLVVFHYHDRPGGVRQVITRGLPELVQRLGGVTEVVLLMGERTDPAWVGELAAALAGVPLRTALHRDLGYLRGEVQEIGKDARALACGVLSGKEVLVWAHNLSVGRNVPLLRHLPQWCASAGAKLWLHHHDWWWDGRWARWADWQAAGVTGLEEALELSVPTGTHIRHWCVNRADLDWVQIRAGKAAQWVGNPLPQRAVPDNTKILDAKAWLHSLTDGRRVWLAPVRALRRKNLAEAIFLAQHQAEPVCIVTTGGPSSLDEGPAWEFLCQTSARHRWPFVPSVLAPGARACSPPHRPARSGLPSLPDLMAAADAIIMPSLQEGFGLPYLEAASFGKPLLARTLTDVIANLAALGCTLPATYAQLPVVPGSFDADRESTRLAARWALLRSGLPKELRMDLESIQPAENMDFGCLSLEAQMEVLQSNASLSIALSRPQVPCWPAESRVDGWAERLFQVPFEEGQHSVDLLPGTGGQNVRPPHKSLLPEVVRRFHHWHRHPLLWP